MIKLNASYCAQVLYIIKDHISARWTRILPLIHILIMSKYHTGHPGRNHSTGLALILWIRYLWLCLGISFVLDIRGPVRDRYIRTDDSAGILCGDHSRIKTQTQKLFEFRS